MKKTVFIIVVSIYGISQFGVILIPNMQPIVHAICYYQFSSEKNADSKDSLLILDSSSYIKAKTDDREVFLNGSLYDIKSIRKIGSTFSLCITKDVDETKWYGFFEDLLNQIKRNQHSQHPINKNLLKWMFSLYSAISPIHNFIFPPNAAAHYLLKDDSSALTSFQKYNFQPPDFRIS